MTNWIALSDRAEFDPSSHGTLDRGLFVLEFALPILQPTVLLQVHADDKAPRAFSIFFDPETGISLLHRQDSQVRRHLLPGPIAQRQGTARLSFLFDAVAQTWEASYQILGEGISQDAGGNAVLPVTCADIQQLCIAGPGTQRHNAALWFGLTQEPSLPFCAAWIGLNTPIDTRRGPVRAGLLRPGDLIATLEDGFQPLLRLARHSFPGRGSFAPVVLRSPFFGLTSDILVSSDQLVLISGASVEYLFGVEEALIAAASLCDNKVAVRDERRAITDAVALDMGRPFAIIADGCCLMSAYTNKDELPRLALRDFEALPLLALLGRTVLRHVA